MAASEGVGSQVAAAPPPQPRRRSRGARVLLRFWWLWLFALPAGFLLLMDWTGSVEPDFGSGSQTLASAPPSPLATAVAERQAWAAEYRAMEPASVGAAAPAVLPAVIAESSPGVLRKSGGGGADAWRFAPSMAAGSYSLGPVDRVSWYREQSAYLQEAVDEVFGLLGLALYEDPAAWDVAWSVAVRDGSAALRDRYAGGAETGWQLALQRWHCSEDLDQGLHQGVTAGCPVAAEWRLLSQAWRRLGQVNETLGQMGATGALYEPDGPWRVVRADAMLALMERLGHRVERFERARVALLEGRDRYGQSVHVTTPDFWRRR